MEQELEEPDAKVVTRENIGADERDESDETMPVRDV